MKTEVSNEFLNELEKLLEEVSVNGRKVKSLLENTHSDDYDEYHDFNNTLKSLAKFRSCLESRSLNNNDR